MLAYFQKHEFFCHQLLLPNIMIFSSVVMSVTMVHSCFLIHDVTLFEYIMIFFYLLHEHFICFPFLTITNNTAKSILVVSFGAYEVFEGRVAKS